MPSIYHHLRTEKQYKAATGLSLAQFDALYGSFCAYYKPKSKNPYPNTPTPALTDKREALFFILHYLKAYPTLENMGLYFGIDIRTVSNYIDYIKPALKAALKESGSLTNTMFHNQEAFNQAFADVEDLVADCTEVPVQRPENEQYQASVYSGKKNSIR
jgi:hypothetical protein